MYVSPKSRTKDVDAAARARTVRILAWGLVGAFLGGLLGARVQLALPTHPWAPWFPAIFAGALPLFMFGFTYALMALSGGMARTLHYPAGSTNVRRSDHSRAASLVVAARYDEAISVYEDAIVENRADPVPYLQIARIYRDKLQQPQVSLKWFKQARMHAQMDDALRLLTLREVVELFVFRLDDPARAIPIVARAAEERPDTDEGRWAAEALADLREKVFGDAAE